MRKDEERGGRVLGEIEGRGVEGRHQGQEEASKGLGEADRRGRRMRGDRRMQ